LRKGVTRRGHAAELIDSENDNDEEVGPYTSANNKAIGEIMEGKKKEEGRSTTRSKFSLISK